MYIPQYVVMHFISFNLILSYQSLLLYTNRVIILRKKPTVLKVIAAGVVLLGLILSLIPVIAGLDKDSADHKQDWLKQSTIKRILWPLCFMLGFVRASQFIIPLFFNLKFRFQLHS